MNKHIGQLKKIAVGKFEVLVKLVTIRVAAVDHLNATALVLFRRPQRAVC